MNRHFTQPLFTQLPAQFLGGIIPAGQGKDFFILQNSRNQILLPSMHADNLRIVPGHLQPGREINQTADPTIAFYFTLRKFSGNGFCQTEKTHVAGNQNA